jgi:hypothetical protein
MSSEEERLYACAEMLEETGEIAQAVSGILTGAQGADVDPRAVISLTAAMQTLDPGHQLHGGQPEGPAGRLRVRLRRRVPRGALRCRGSGPGAPAGCTGTPGAGCRRA